MTAAQLEAQIKARLGARVDAALAAGKISAERAAALKQRIASSCSARAAAVIRSYGTASTGC